MTITISRVSFWTWLCRFAFRRAVKRGGATPTGLPGHRDPGKRCDFYWPTDRSASLRRPVSAGPCQSDGHYLCRDCEWLDPERLVEIEERNASV